MNILTYKGKKLGSMINGLKLIPKHKHKRGNHFSYDNINLNLIKGSFYNCPKEV